MAFDENRGGDQGGFQRRMYQGDWACSSCGGKITELPFDPDPSRLDQLKCRDCHQKSRASFRRDRF